MPWPHPDARPESSIERAACEAARADGWLPIKAGQNGWPDRVFLKDGVTVWIEFKRHDGRVSRIQAWQHMEIEAHGGRVGVCRSAEETMRLLRRHYAEAKGPPGL